MYAIMKFEYEAPIYDDLGFGVTLKDILKALFRLGYSRRKVNSGGS